MDMGTGKLSDRYLKMTVALRIHVPMQDTRFTMAAPSCFITTFEKNLEVCSH